ncbi:hypothetical protein B488_03050 [Liberibacter crescens BT-1]|uniref:Uncharacterized protein n=1 Tax=Liberibacter crescens (strain BT-1) TaxID=1215343 RepID=L0EUF3_LIBCB|nr:hypothetical protein B488_03050 [Liberibacter crescens BT-1]
MKEKKRLIISEIRDDVLIASSIAIFLANSFLLFVWNRIFSIENTTRLVMLITIGLAEIFVRKPKSIWVLRVLFISFILCLCRILYDFQAFIIYILNDINIVSFLPVSDISSLLIKIFMFLYFQAGIFLYLFYWRYKIVVSLVLAFYISISGIAVELLFFLYKFNGLHSIEEYGIYVIIGTILLLFIISVSYDYLSFSGISSYSEVAFILNTFALPILLAFLFYIIYPHRISFEEISFNLRIQVFMIFLIPFLLIFTAIIFDRPFLVLSGFLCLAIILYYTVSISLNIHNFILCILFSCGSSIFLLHFFWKFLRSFFISLLPEKINQKIY